MRSEQKLKVGNTAPSFTLEGADGKAYSLSDFDKPVLIVFMCNHCPYVQPKLARMKSIQEKYKDKLVVIGINSNNNPEYPEDDFESMQKVIVEKNFNFIYLFDEDQEVAKAYGAVCTPDPFLFDKDKKLVYHGRFDNALNPGETPTQFDMEEAIEKMFKGEIIKDFRPSQGCSIKWV